MFQHSSNTELSGQNCRPKLGAKRDDGTKTLHPMKVSFFSFMCLPARFIKVVWRPCARQHADVAILKSVIYLMHFRHSISPGSSETMPRYFSVSKLGEGDTDNASLIPRVPLNYKFSKLGPLSWLGEHVYCSGHLEIKGLF